MNRQFSFNIAILVTIVILAACTGWLFYGVQRANDRQGTAIRTVFCYFEQRTLQSPKLTSAQKREAIDIYSTALGLIHEPSCKGD